MQTSSVEALTEGETAQRVYGMSFANKKEGKEWTGQTSTPGAESDKSIDRMKAAEERNHRTIGRKQKLFMTHESAPGTPGDYCHTEKCRRSILLT